MPLDLSVANALEDVLACAFIGLCTSAAILWLLLRTGLAWRLAIDIPNARSLHTRPTPRVGGWSIVPVACVLIGMAAPALWLPALLGALLAILSQIDDRHGLPARVRLVGHIAAVLALVIVYPVDIGWWLLAILAFLLVWLTNLYNFMDGSDGLAGGMAFFGFSAYAVVGLTSAHPNVPLAIACAAVAGAVAGFLVFNFHPAKIFLGDAGSIPLGFWAGALGYWGWRSGAWPIWYPAVIFSPFIGDASFTLLKRLMRREKIWLPHREHYYQRMVRSGMGHARTAWLWYAVMLGGALLANYAVSRPPIFQWSTVVVWTVVLCSMGVAVDLRWSRFQSTQSSRSGL